MRDKFLQFLGIVKKSGNLVEGYNKCEEIIKSNKLFLIIISENCSSNTKEKFIRHCTNCSLPYVEAYNSKELGNAVGRDEINILGVTNKNMSDNLILQLKEQSTI
ncbi:ribosomal L7Ae/L30e/S12e/Gadd45 family protein [Candidatus Clostridium stratigraminis]|uniref:Ribosomal L7Ae/L30e/S12e/Gadd45 family protein n=1 Tax=Candidatus Clostridium stratigraminis TaxID=3381661 RepID=A0ABW8T794_9CLOT